MTTLSQSLPLTRIGTRLGAGIAHTASSVLSHLDAARKLRETRRQLATMDDRMLSDIGVSRAQIEFELDRAPRGR
jgi:uncharacterized protein YjiS (DUF1127 family)